MEQNKPIECYFTLGGINYKNGFVTSCPQQPEKMMDMNVTIKPSEIFNSELFRQHRLEMMNGKWSHGCHLCKDPEKINSHSMRQDYTPVLDYYDPATGAVDFKGLRHVELRFSNSCNMACKHCSVVYSSGWVSKLKHYSPDQEVEKHNLLQLLKTEHRESEWDDGELGLTIPQVEEIVNDLIQNFPDLEKVEFAGGEVLHQKQFFPCLRMLHNHPNIRNISIGFHTNFNARFDPVELSNLLKPFKHSIIHMSLDAGKNIYPYFRTGDWEKLKSNIKEFREVNRHTFLSIVCTTSAYQVMDIEDVMRSFLELDVDTVNPAMVYTPKYLNPAIMCTEFREETIQDLKSARQIILDELARRESNTAESYKLRAWKSRLNRFNDIHMALYTLDEIENYVLNHKTTSNYWEDFQVYVRKTDEIWGHSFNDYMQRYKLVDGRIRRA